MSAEADRLPAGWTIGALTDVADLNPTNPNRPPLDSEPVSFIPMAAVTAISGDVDLSEQRNWGEVKKGYTRFQDGDVVFAKITPCMENGKSAVLRHLVAGIGAGSTEFHVLRPTEAIDANLLRYYVLQEDFRKASRSKMTGTAGQLRVPTTFLEDQRLPIAPLPEQHRIVAAIEDHFSRLDEAVALLQKVQRNLKRYRASVLKAAVEGRLVPIEANLARAEGRTYEPATKLLERILEERRRRWKENGVKGTYKEPVTPDITDLPELPEGWCWVCIDVLAEFVTSGSRGWAEHYNESGPMFIRIGNLQHGAIGLDLAKVQRVQPPSGAEGLRTRVRPRDILVSITADVGMIGLVPDGVDESYVNQHVALVRPVGPIDSRFLAWSLTSPSGQSELNRLGRGATKAGLGLDDIRAARVALPPLSEQRRIVGEVERLVSVGEEAGVGAQAALLRAIRLRQSILKWAFEGRLADQDPTDEPASVLLERIRAERATNAVHSPRGLRGKERTRRNP